jgi:hypothetical protein
MLGRKGELAAGEFPFVNRLHTDEMTVRVHVL